MSGLLTTIGGLSRREQAMLARTRYGAVVRDLPDKEAAVFSATAALSEFGEPFALIGGLAVGIRSGVPRATLDVDFAVQSTASREAVIARMVDAGFAHRGSHPHSENFVHPSGEPTQLAFDPGFDPMLLRAEALDLGGVRVPVVTKDDLIAMKRRAAADPRRRRSKALRDAADVALLEEGPVEDEGW